VVGHCIVVVDDEEERNAKRHQRELQPVDRGPGRKRGVGWVGDKVSVIAKIATSENAPVRVGCSIFLVPFSLCAPPLRPG
jgi:hypothetical protein